MSPPPPAGPEADRLPDEAGTGTDARAQALDGPGVGAGGSGGSGGSGASGGAGGPPAAGPARRRWPRRLAWALLGLIALLLLGVAGLLLALRTTAGTRAVLGAVPGLQVQELRGAVLGDFTARRLQWTSASLRVEARDLAWTAMRPERVASVRWGWGLAVDRLAIGRLTIWTRPAPAAPRSGAPTTLALPVAVRIGELRIDELQASALGERPLQALRAAVRLGHPAAAGGRAEHRVDLHALRWDRLSGQGWLSVGVDAPMPLQGALSARADAVLAGAQANADAAPAQRPAAAAGARKPGNAQADRARPRPQPQPQQNQAERAKKAPATATPADTAPHPATDTATQRAREATRDAPQAAAKAAAQAVAATAAQAASEAATAAEARAVSAQARIGGTLARWSVQASAQARSQSLSLQARVTPFDAWPVDRLQLQARGFDLAALDSRAPRTRLTGEASLLPVAPQLQAAPPAAAGSRPAAPPAGNAARAIQPQDAQTAVRVRLRNDAAGRWDEGRLPVRDLDLRLRLAGLSIHRGWVDGLAATLGSAEQPGGQLAGRGRWVLDCLPDCTAPAGTSGGANANPATNPSARPQAATASAPGAVSTSTPAPAGQAASAAASAPTAGNPVAAVAAAGGAWSVQLDLRDLRPAALDQRAPQMRLSGPVQLEQTALAPGAQGLRLRVDLQGQLEAVSPPAPLDMRGQVAYTPGETLVAALSSRLGAARVALNAVAQSVDAASSGLLEPARAPSGGARPATRAGPASAAGSGRSPDWRIEADASLDKVDPLAWWPGGPAPVAAPSDLNGLARLQLVWRGQTPEQAAAEDAAEGPSLWQTVLQRLGGEGDVRLQRSLLLGVPLDLQLQLKDQRGGAASGWQLEGRLEAGGNALTASGQVDRSPREADRWRLALDAPALERLSAWAALGGVRRLTGALRGEATLEGRFPRLSSAGQLSADKLAVGLPAAASPQAAAPRPRSAQPVQPPAAPQAALPAVIVAGRPQPADERTVAPARPAPRSDATAPPLALHEADRVALQWRIGAVAVDSSAPLSARVEADGLRSSGWRVNGLRAQAEGSAVDHRFSAQAAVLPPRQTDPAGLPPTRLLADLLGQGHWAASPRRADGWRWDGRLAQVQLARDPASLPVLSARLRAAADQAAAQATADNAAQAAQPPLTASAAARRAATRLALPDFSRPWLRAERLALSVFQANGRLGAELGAARIESLGAVLDVQQARWQDHGAAGPDLDVAARLEPLAVAPVLAVLQPQVGWGGDLTVAGSLRWQRRAGATAAAGRTTLQAELVRHGGDLSLIETDLEGGLRQRLSLTEARLAIDARDGIWRLSERLAARGSATVVGEQTLRTTPAALLPDAGAALAGRLDAQVADVRRWSAWMPAGWQLGGQLAARLALAGTAGQPIVTGRIEGRALEARNLLQGIDLRDGTLDLSLQGDQAVLERFIARAGRGSLQLSGQADIGAVPRALLRLQLTDFALLQRVDRRAVLSGRADLDLREQALSVQGAFQVVEGLVDISRSDAPALGDDVTVIRRPPGTDPAAPPEGTLAGAPGEPAPAEPGLLQRLSADVRVDLGRNLRLRGRGIDTRLGGQLRLTADPQVAAGQPRLTGTVNTVRGTYAAYGQKLAIDRGAITFIGPIDNPQLDILATRARSAFTTASTGAATLTDTEVIVGVLITGTAQNPRVRLHSVPDMAESEKLSWLLFGRGTGGLASQETALLQTAAMALLSGEGEGTTGQIMSAIGLDEFSLRQGASAGGGNVQDTVVTLGKQISRRLYLGYERGLSDTLGTWQIIYRLARRVTLRAQSGADNSLDLIWTLTWN